MSSCTLWGTFTLEVYAAAYHCGHTGSISALVYLTWVSVFGCNEIKNKYLRKAKTVILPTTYKREKLVIWFFETQAELPNLPNLPNSVKIKSPLNKSKFQFKIFISLWNVLNVK